MFVSAALRYGSIPERAVTAALTRCTVLFSRSTWAELHDVLMREKFERYRSFRERRQFLDALQIYFDPVEVTSKIEACRHPVDNKFLELAVDGRADLILTGDRDLLTLHPFRGIVILNADSFLNWVES